MKNTTDETKAKDEKQEDVEVQEASREDECQELLEECNDKYKRALADYQNLEKRVLEERREWIKSSNKQLLLRLLPVLDTLILASKHSEDQSLKISVQQFLEVLKQEGVEKIETENKMFDPKYMECIETVDGTDGKVIEEIRPGYKLHDSVIRVAQVKVGKGEK